MSSIILIISLLNIFIIIVNRRCHTINNLLICDISLTSIIFSILHIIGSIYGFRENWYYYQPLCILRAYLLMVIVTAFSYSCLIQGISRLFFSVFYKHRFLLGWFTHWILIIFKWFICFLFSIQPLFIEYGFGLRQGYRMCGVTTEILSVALYTIIISFIIPESFVTTVYIIILYQVHQSTRRITSIRNQNFISTYSSLPSAKRNLKIMQKTILILNILICSGTPYFILTIWDIIHHQSVPKEFYFLSVNITTLGITIMTIVIFVTNKIVKDIIHKYLC